jgi:hypothetical protein
MNLSHLRDRMTNPRPGASAPLLAALERELSVNFPARCSSP